MNASDSAERPSARPPDRPCARSPEPSASVRRRRYGRAIVRRSVSFPISIHLLLLLTLALSVHGSSDCQAAGWRAELRSRSSWTEMRTFVRETIPESLVSGDGVRRRLEDGTVVICIPGEDECYWFRPGDVESATPLVQELRVAGWGGTQGLSGRLHVRSRYGSDALWPRSEEELELVAGYLELDRERFRLRAGRQSRQSGLGFYEFDGGAALWRARPGISVELFVGRSLARGLSQPLTGFLLEENDEFAPDEPGVLIGGEIRARLHRRFAASVVYQREIRFDRAGLYSERLGLDVQSRFGRPILEASLEHDLGAAQVNELTARLRLPFEALEQPFEATARGRYRRPYFDLWTIWEAFVPVGYEEGALRLSWQGLRFGVYGEGSYRTYDETNADVQAFPVRDDGWQASLGGTFGSWGWQAEGAYTVEVGFGAAQDHAQLSVHRVFERGRVGVQGFVSQQTREFRIGEDWIVGGGVLGSYRLGDLQLDGSAGWHRLSYRNRADYPDWNQGRATLAIRYAFGNEPSYSVEGGAAPESDTGRSGE